MDISTPLLTGGGYLALPTLQNAYSDLHLALEFKPTSWTGSYTVFHKKSHLYYTWFGK